MKCIVVGHLTKDILNGRERIGGGAYYSSLALSELCKVTVITKVGPDFPRKWLEGLRERGVDVRTLPSSATTTYKFTYRDGWRELTLLSKGDPFTDEELVGVKGDLIILNPVAGEIAPRQVAFFDNPSLDVQGFIRGFENGRVVLRETDGSFLSAARVVHASVEEFRVLKNISLPEVLLVTNGASEGFAVVRGRKYIIKPYRVDVRDTTGAGDVFLAFFSYLYTRLPFTEALDGALRMTAEFLKGRDDDASIG
ncbi:PfkB family carbohydrate kinase [Pyrococcus yayanosii]|uniref:Carbohydrate kinase, putative, PfkB family n=1 Tax=Pyrococcus yayanosii (strain CH1 / JCM 16557) TaxID=529709 RepID=F8AF58_PYRYC|nr:PfkB family carbohydrate kinase [Pyrococcus yayanosii]AEH23732.1 Carbohydrate kinase, putative, PfkB family [Pyrococcus yayanosii CH1]